MRPALIPAFLLLLGSVVLGATVLREPVAWAAQTVDANIIGPLDGNGNVKVHEQGTANVNVTNSSLAVAPSAATVVHFSSVWTNHRVDTFSPIKASLLVVSFGNGPTFAASTQEVVGIYNGDQLLFELSKPADGGAFVVPMPQSIPIDKVRITPCDDPEQPCAAAVTIAGT